MKLFKRVLPLLCVSVLFFGCVSPAAWAEDTNVIYGGKADGLVFESGGGRSLDCLFADFPGIMPGASLVQKITVKNTADGAAKIKLYLRALGSEDETYNDFLSRLTLTVAQAGDAPQFEPAPGQAAGLTEQICLGTLYAGGSADLELTLSVPTTLDDTFQKQSGRIRWQFIAEEFPITQPGFRLPDGWWILLPVVAISLIVILRFWRNAGKKQ